MQDVKIRVLSSTGGRRSDDPPPAGRKTVPARIFVCIVLRYPKIINDPSPSPTVKARFERVLASVVRTPLYMGTAVGFDIALVIAKASSSKATDQQLERLGYGYGSSLDENVT